MGFEVSKETTSTSDYREERMVGTNSMTYKWRSALCLLTIAGTILLHTSQAKAENPIRIMALGDSLTSSIEGQASYRYWLWKRLQAAGFRVDFVGSCRGVGAGHEPAYGDFDQQHEGHPGAMTDDICYGIDFWARQQDPEVVILLVGGTDFEQGASPQQALANSRKIIKRLRALNPNVAIVWAMLPPAWDQLPQDKAYNAGLLRSAAQLSRPTSPVKVVNLWSNFYPESDTVDGQHPNASGEKKFAKRIYNVLAPILARMK